MTTTLFYYFKFIFWGFFAFIFERTIETESDRRGERGRKPGLVIRAT